MKLHGKGTAAKFGKSSQKLIDIYTGVVYLFSTFIEYLYIYSQIKMELKEHRQSILLDILRHGGCHSQKDIVKEMQLRGCEVTQPSISRDFKELGVVKLGGRYTVLGSEVEAEHVQEATFQVLDATPAGANLLVLKTPTGAASLVAIQIDKLGLQGIVGTVAGDDTIFVATKSKRVQRKLLDQFGRKGEHTN